MNSLLLFKEHF